MDKYKTEKPIERTEGTSNNNTGMDMPPSPASILRSRKSSTTHEGVLSCSYVLQKLMESLKGHSVGDK